MLGAPYFWSPPFELYDTLAIFTFWGPQRPHKWYAECRIWCYIYIYTYIYIYIVCSIYIYREREYTVYGIYYTGILQAVASGIPLALAPKIPKKHVGRPFVTICYHVALVPCTRLYYTILYYTILYYTILYYTILCYIILYYTILYYTILYYTILYYIILYYTILYYTILYYIILYYTILYYTILY